MMCKKNKPEIIKVCGENLRKLEVVLERYVEVLGVEEDDDWDKFAEKLLDKVQQKSKGAIK